MPYSGAADRESFVAPEMTTPTSAAVAAQNIKTMKRVLVGSLSASPDS